MYNPMISTALLFAPVLLGVLLNNLPKIIDRIHKYLTSKPKLLKFIIGLIILAVPVLVVYCLYKVNGSAADRPIYYAINTLLFNREGL